MLPAAAISSLRPPFWPRRPDPLARLPIPTPIQDFNSYADGTNLRGVELLPGVTADCNMTSLVDYVTVVERSHVLFGYDSTTRALGTAYYDLNVGR